MSVTTLKIVQLNMARSLVVSEELRSFCSKGHIDIALVSEPYTRQNKLLCLEEDGIRVLKSNTWTSNGSSRIWAAIIIFNQDLGILAKPHVTNEFFVGASVSKSGSDPVDILAGYFQYRKPTADFTTYLEEKSELLCDRLIMGLDVNAFSSRWHHPTTNQKGRQVEDMIDRLQLHIANRPGKSWTFSGPRGRSNIDVTLSSNSLANKVRSWTVLDGATSSDHALISFAIENDNHFVLPKPAYRFRDKCIPRMLSLKIDESLKQSWDPRLTLDDKAQLLSTCIIEACELTL